MSHDFFDAVRLSLADEHERPFPTRAMCSQPHANDPEINSGEHAKILFARYSRYKQLMFARTFIFGMGSVIHNFSDDHVATTISTKNDLIIVEITREILAQARTRECMARVVTWLILYSWEERTAWLNPLKAKRTRAVRVGELLDAIDATSTLAFEQVCATVAGKSLADIIITLTCEHMIPPSEVYQDINVHS